MVSILLLLLVGVEIVVWLTLTKCPDPHHLTTLQLNDVLPHEESRFYRIEGHRG